MAAPGKHRRVSKSTSQRHKERLVGRVYDQQHGTRPGQGGTCSNKDDVVDWIVMAHALLNSQPECVTKSFKVCGISNNLDGSENALIHCAKELPAYTIPYGNDDSDEDIFNRDRDSTYILVTVMMEMRNKN